MGLCRFTLHLELRGTLTLYLTPIFLRRPQSHLQDLVRCPRFTITVDWWIPSRGCRVATTLCKMLAHMKDSAPVCTFTESSRGRNANVSPAHSPVPVPSPPLLIPLKMGSHTLTLVLCGALPCSGVLPPCGGTEEKGTHATGCQGFYTAP